MTPPRPHPAGERPARRERTAGHKSGAGKGNGGKSGTSKAGPRTATRGGPPGRWARLQRGVQKAWIRVLEMPPVWATLLVLLGTWTLLPGGLFFTSAVEPDTIAQRDYTAPADQLLLDEEATREKRRRAQEEVLPIYDFDRALVAEQDAAFERLFATGRRLVGSDPESLRGEAGWREDVAERLAGASGLKITPQQAAVLTDWAFTPDLEDRVRSVVRQALRRGVVTTKDLLLENRMRGVTLRDIANDEERQHLDLYDHLGYPDELRDFLEAEVRDWLGLSSAERRAMVELMLANVPPNLSPNPFETQRRREQAAADTAPAFNRISKGEVIVRKGDRIDAATAELLSELSGDRHWSRSALPLAGTLLLLGLAALALWITLQRERPTGRGAERLYGEAVLVTLLGLLGAKFCFVTASALAASFEAVPFNSAGSYVYAIPFASVALVAALLLGRTPALLVALVYSLLVARLAGGDASAVVLFSFAGSLAAVYALERYQFKQRLVLMRVGVLVGLVNVAVVVLQLALAGGTAVSPARVVFDLVCGFAGGLLVAAAAGFAVPVLESLLGIATDIKLIELANTNLPVLRRLAFEAPGTFQHSLMVANLSKEGCEAIGADATLAYTGGLYHDIGKVFRPEYFIENQRPGQNRHDKLTPSMSALILINHIKDGVELARRHHLPQPIIDAIEQHHGTRLIKYFYNRALERCDPDTEEVREDEYRYPGPKPQDKVMGVLMLADGIEAASRTLVEPTSTKVRTLIRTIVDDCLRDGQLDHTDLTLSDLRRISDAFHRVLSTIFHQRIDYPGFDFNAQPRRERPAAVEPARAS